MSNIKELAAAVERGEAVNISREGKWYVEGLFMRLVRRLFRIDHWRVQRVAEQIIKELAAIENQDDHVQHYAERFKNAGYLESGRYRQIAGRLEARGEVNKEITDKIIQMAEQRYGGLHSLNLQKIEEASRYSEFCRLLLKEKKVQNDFFNWIINKGCPTEVFIRFPLTAQKLRSCYADSACGYFAYTKPLQVEGNDLLIRIEGKMQSLFSEESQEVLKEGKRGILGRYRIVQEKGYTKERVDPAQVDFSQKRWWEQLHPFEVIPKEVAERRYNLKIKPGFWVHMPAASKKIYGKEPSRGLYLDDCHGNEIILEPLKGGERYRVHPYGKYVKEWPETLIKVVKWFGDTREALYTPYDPTLFYASHRDVACSWRQMSPQLGERFMQERIGKQLQKSLSGNMVFQLLNRDCAHQPQKNAEWIAKQQGGSCFDYYLEHVGNLRARLKPLNFIFITVSAVPEMSRGALITAYNLMLGYRRGMWVKKNKGGKTFRSVANSSYVTGISSKERKQILHYHIHLPSKLHQRIRNNEVPGTAWRFFHGMQY